MKSITTISLSIFLFPSITIAADNAFIDSGITMCKSLGEASSTAYKWIANGATREQMSVNDIKMQRIIDDAFIMYQDDSFTSKQPIAAQAFGYKKRAECLEDLIKNDLVTLIK